MIPPRMACLWTVAVVACGGAPSVDRSAPGAGPVADVDTLRMPAYPAPRPGRLVAASPTNPLLAADAPARAGRCLSDRSIQVFAEDSTFGMLMRFRPAGEEDPVQTYPAGLSDSPVTLPVAHLAVQLFEERRWSVYRADSGSIELSRLDDRASGRFAVRLESPLNQFRAVAAGVFQELPVVTLSALVCGDSVEGQP